MSIFDRAITCTFLIIPTTCMDGLFVSKHLDIPSLIKSSEQPLLRESISMRSTYKSIHEKNVWKITSSSFLI